MPSTVAFQIAANENEDIIYAATETGPYVYLKDEDKWFPLSGNSTPTRRIGVLGIYLNWQQPDLAPMAEVYGILFLNRPGFLQRWAEEESAIQLWPMPVVGEVNWKSELNFDRITLYHVNGMPVKEIQVGRKKVDVKFLPGRNLLLVFSVGKNKLVRK